MKIINTELFKLNGEEFIRLESNIPNVSEARKALLKYLAEDENANGIHFYKIVGMDESGEDHDLEGLAFENFMTLEEAGLENPPEYDTVPGSQRAYYADEGD